MMSNASLYIILILPIVNLFLSYLGFKYSGSKTIVYLKSFNFLALVFFLFSLYINNEETSVSFGSWLELSDLKFNWTFAVTRATSLISLFITLVYLFNFLSIEFKNTSPKNWRECFRPAILFFILITACFSGNLFTFLFFYLIHTIAYTRVIDSSKGFSFEIASLYLADLLIVFSVINLFGLKGGSLSSLNPSLIINDGFYLNCFLVGFLFKNFFAPHFFINQKKSFVNSWSGLYFVLLHSTIPIIILILKLFSVINLTSAYLQGLVYLGTLVFILNSLKALFEKEFKNIFLCYVNGIKGIFLLSLGLNDFGVGLFLTVSSALGLIPFLFLGDRFKLTIDKVPRVKESYRVLFGQNIKGNLYLLFSLFSLLLLPFLPQTLGYAHILMLIERSGLDYLLGAFIFGSFVYQLNHLRLFFLISLQKNTLKNILNFNWQAWLNLIFVILFLIFLGVFSILKAENGGVNLFINEWIIGKHKITLGAMKDDTFFGNLLLLGTLPLGSFLIFGIYILKGPYLSEKIERYQFRYSRQLSFLKNDMYIGSFIKQILRPIFNVFKFLFEFIVQGILYNKIFNLVGELVFESGVLLSNYSPKRLNSRLNYILFGTIIMFWILYLRLV